ncbi:scavenger receptor class B member 1-like [Pectinophora gossypiella]|uniref:scavenger receptor class B member 1-like n=1 Tax=Pectinophora gossypiella TaxID=13191 RepID=UPI00214E0881|nr:scavenger receptor class B member 1-like [Pectinophora gossypiella]
MVVGRKSIQHVQSKGRMSIMKIQNFTVQKRQSVIKVVYGGLLVIIAIIMVAIDPINIVTNWYMDMKEGSFLFKMYQKPSYQLFSEVWIYNYTNVPEYLAGTDSVMKLQEVGPFRFQETRTNEDMKINKEQGILTIVPKITLKFLPERSVAHYKDVSLYMPNIALIAISTLAADKLGYFANAGAYYSISALGSTLFRNLTAEELLWGYHDPVVTIANSLLPGWIDFGKIGILDRFYAEKQESAEIELANESTRYSIKSWNNSTGLIEQGFTDWNTSIPCNRIKGSYEGMMVSPKVTKDRVIPIYRRQACRIYPFSFKEEVKGNYGFDYYRFALERTSFNRTSEYACKCEENCLPDGFVDVSKCYYGFPIALSKPHFLDTDPEQMKHFEGMHPDPEKHGSVLDLEPTLGVPLALSTKIQVNVAVRMNAGNPITRPLKDKVIPIVWLSLYCEEPPPEIVSILRLRFVIAPPLLITVEVLLLVIGMILGAQGFHRIWKPKYKLIQSNEEEMQPKRRKSLERRRNSVILNMSENMGFTKDDEELAKQAVSLLAIHEEDADIPDLLLTENQIY